MLNQYPSQIHRAALNLNEIESHISLLRRQQEGIETEIEMTIAFSSDLKNDNQRKAVKAESLQKSEYYTSVIEQLHAATLEKANALAELERLRNEFAVAKLESRIFIVSKLTGVDDIRELVEM